MPFEIQRYKFATRDREQLCSFLESVGFRVETAPERSCRLDASLNGFSMPDIYIGRVRYGAPLALRAETRDGFWLQMPLSGSFEVASEAGQSVYDVSRGGLASLTGAPHCQVRPDEAYSGLTVCISKSLMYSSLQSMLGDEPVKPLIFFNRIDLSTGPGRSLAQQSLLAWSVMMRGGASWEPETVSAFQQFVTTLLLKAQPHNYTEKLRHLERPLAPRDVKRVMDYIHANLASPITIADFVRTTGVPGRTLFKHFKDATGASPMEYLRNARFEHARSALLKATPEDSITDIATSVGFTHLGRFASEYSRRYGERPSQTLRRRFSQS